MFCPNCNSEQNFVVNSRQTSGGFITWRRRKCLKCASLFTTHESVDMANFVVVKRDGRRERFSRIKLFSGILWASIGVRLKDREKKIEKISETIEKQILSLNKSVLTTAEIAHIVMRQLWDTHISLFLRFMSYRSQVKNKRQFIREMELYGKVKEVTPEQIKKYKGDLGKTGFGDFD